MKKRKIIFLLAACLQLAVCSEAQTVTISMRNVSVKQVLRKIQQLAQFNVIADEAVLDKASNVNIDVKNASLDEVLKQCFKNQLLSYSIVDKTIVVKPDEKNENGSITTTTIEKEADNFIDVVGKVIGPDTKPISGVTVTNINTKKGTTTGKDGSFHIPASPGDILSFSHIGYKAKSETISSFTTGIIVSMELAEVKEEEVIVTSYQRIKKSQMTGAVSKVKGEDLMLNGGTNTIEQALQGKLAGVVVTSGSGEVGTRQKVRVRGTSTLLGNQDPVWVVDGIIQEDPLPFKASELNKFDASPASTDLMKNFVGSAISWLNPFDIEDITVLKDAASTAIYGVKAANGVILINTKRGKVGNKPLVSYNGSFSTQSMYNYDRMNLMNSKERVDVSREIWERGLISSNSLPASAVDQSSLDNVGYSGMLRQYLQGKIKYDEFNAGVKQLEVNNTDWFHILFTRPVSQNHSIGVSGGSAVGTYYGSFGYSNQTGQAIGNGQESYKGSFNFTSNISTRIKVSARISGDYTTTTAPFAVDPYAYATTTSRVIPAYMPDGSLSYYRLNGYKFNVLNELAHTGNTNIKSTLNTNVNMQYKLPIGFMFESSLGLSYQNTHAESYASELTNRITIKRGYEYGQFQSIDPLFKQSPLPYGGELNTQDSRNINYTWRNGLNYGKVFNRKHSVTALVGIEVRSNINKGLSNTAYGYMPDMGKFIIPPPLQTTNASNGQVLPNSIIYGSTDAAGANSTTITDAIANYASYYATGSYTYSDKYTFSASLRGDASNRFGQDTRQRFNPIWALGANWNAYREKWFENAKWLSNLSFRASYGFQGNVAENYGPDLVAKRSVSITSTSYDNTLSIVNFPYTNLRQEKTQSINLGTDFGFLKERISGSIDYYIKKSKDLIVMRDIPYENGRAQMPINDGTLTNIGYDMTLNFIPVRTKNFQWNFGITSSMNKNKVTNKQLQNPNWNAAVTGQYFVQGYPVSGFWVFDFKGLDSATGRPTFNMPTTAANPDAKFDATQFMKYAGKADPDYTAGLSTSLRYKQLTVGTDMYLSMGNHKLLTPLYTPDMTKTTPNEYNNLSADLVNRWRKPGDNKITNIPSLPDASAATALVAIPSGGTTIQSATESPYTLYNYSTARLVNASYLKINNINVSYILPVKLARKIFSKSLIVGYTMGNVYTFVSKDYKGVDPQVASGSAPLPRTHVFTLTASF